MAKLKVTFTLDDWTIRQLGQAAERTGKPKSEVVREAIQDYHERVGRLSERERLRLLKVFDEVVPDIPERSSSEVDQEIQRIRASRRSTGRRHRR